MRATVRKWGNSLALRIPSGLAADAHLCDGTEVDVAVEGGRLVVVPVAAPEVALDALLAGITPENLHAEQASDGARGAEAW
jgi:antitoxin MazE